MKKPITEDGLSSEIRERLEAAANQMAAIARSKFALAKQEEAGSDGQRFIEHGATCYYNCWGMLREALDGASPHPSAVRSGLVGQQSQPS